MRDESRVRLPAAVLRVSLVLTVAFGVLSIYALHDSRNDDAYITFRYGQNLASGRAQSLIEIAASEPPESAS